MPGRKLAAVLAASMVAMAGRAPRAAGAGDATLLRVFLMDGSSLASYGEPARVADRVVFSMPTAAVQVSTSDPPLQLVNLPLARVDWERTERYANAARASHYVATDAEIDYAALSNQIAKALYEVTQSNDSARRLAVAEDARKLLAEWPAAHFNYRQAEVRQLLGMLDEAIADLRVSAGAQKIDLSLLAFADPPAIVEPLMPPPTPKEAIEQVLSAARIVDTAADREALLSTALVGLTRDAGSLPADWVAAVRADTQNALETDQRIDQSYRSLTTRVMRIAGRRSRAADVRGVERLVALVGVTDRELGEKRPEAVNALLAAVQGQLDAARKLRLARDHWALRAPDYRRYSAEMRVPLERFSAVKPSLEAIKALAGSSPAALAGLEDAVSQALKRVSAIAPPDELRAAHALLVSAMQLAASAARIRGEAVRDADVARAWDASSAAAGALMLDARARTAIQTMLHPPQLQ